jgi:hypothetical protein
VAGEVLVTFSAVLGRYDAFAFFTGESSVSTTALQPFTVALGGHIYPIDLRNYRHSSQDVLRDGAVVQAETSDSLFNANGAWSRYRYTWHQGADQEVGDLREDANQFRFDTSVGINVWTEGELSLLQDTAVAKALTASGNVLCNGNGRLYLSDGTALYFTTDLTAWTTATAPGGTIQAITTDGVDIYVATTTGLVKYANAVPGTPVAFSTPVTGNCTMVAFVGNRLLMAKDNILYEVGASGTLTTIQTHYQPTFKWTTAFAVGSKIYFGGFAGIRSELYNATVDSTGNLVQSVEAAPLPAGELLRTGQAYSGAVLLCTSQGARLATVGADGTLTYGPLISSLGDVKCAAFEGRFAWTGWTNHPSGGRGTARLALDTTVTTLQPAYASDVYETANTSADVTQVVRFNGQTVFIVDGQNVYKTTSSYLTTGILDSGEIYFGTVEDKAITAGQATFQPLVSGESVFMAVYDDQGTLIGDELQTEISSETLNFSVSGSKARHIRVKVTLTGPGTSTPQLHFWRLRAYPVPPAVTQWIVPLIVHTRVVVGSGMGQELTMSARDEADRIRDWFQSRDTINYQEGERSYRVRVDAFELQPADWTDDGMFFQHTLVVRLVSA